MIKILKNNDPEIAMLSIKSSIGKERIWTLTNSENFATQAVMKTCA